MRLGGHCEFSITAVKRKRFCMHVKLGKSRRKRILCISELSLFVSSRNAKKLAFVYVKIE